MSSTKPPPAACPANGHSEIEWPSAETTACPYPFYESLRTSAPVYKYPGRNEYLVSRWAEIVEVARKPEVFSHMIHTADPAIARVRALPPGSRPSSERRYTPYGMASSDPPEHKLKRALGLRLLTKERLRSYEAMVRRHVNELIDGWIYRGSCEWRSEFAELLPAYVIAEALGLPQDDAPMFIRFGQSESQGARYLDDERVASEVDMYREAAGYCRAALERRVAEPREDLLSELIRAQTEQDGVLDLNYLTIETLTLLLAGNVTTTHMLASAMTLLCQHPETMAQVRAQPRLAATLCDETIRLESPLQWHLRVCKVDTVLGGVEIPAGAMVVVLYGSGNRDEDRFSDPGRFDLERENLVKHHLGFGHGSHRCLGAPLARLEGQVTFEILLARLAHISLSDSSDLDPVDSVRFRAPKKIMISFEPTPTAG